MFSFPYPLFCLALNGNRAIGSPKPAKSAQRAMKREGRYGSVAKSVYATDFGRETKNFEVGLPSNY